MAKQTSRPTPEQVLDEIGKLRSLVGRLRNSAFGDDNNAACEAQAAVLENRWDEDEVYSRYGRQEGTDEYPEDSSDSIEQAALDAVYWLRGESESESLAAEWEPLKLGAE